MTLSVTGDATAGKARRTSVFVSKELLYETEVNIDDETTTDNIPDADINDSTISGKDTGNAIVMKQANGEYGIAIAKGPGLADGWSKLRPLMGDSDTELVTQPDPTAETATATLTIAELLTKIIAGTPAAAATYTLPTGTLTDAGVSMSVNDSFDWSIINLAAATHAITLAAGTDHTIVGKEEVPADTSALFRTRKTAANTFVTYRLS